MYSLLFVFILLSVTKQSSVVVFGVSQRVRRIVILRQNNRCGMCNDTFTIMKPHEIHHLNHQSKDNNITNLLALCANCHSAHHRFDVPAKPFFVTKTQQEKDIYYKNYIKEASDND